MLYLFYIALSCILSVVSYRIIMGNYVLDKPKNSRIGLIFLLVGYCCFEWYLGIVQSVNENIQSNNILLYIIECSTYCALCFAGFCFSVAGFLIVIVEVTYICIETAGIIKNFFIRNPQAKPLFYGVVLVIAGNYLKNLEFIEFIYLLTFPIVMKNFLYQLKLNN